MDYWGREKKKKRKKKEARRRLLTLNTTNACPRIFLVFNATTSIILPNCEYSEYNDRRSSANEDTIVSNGKRGDVLV